MAWHISWAIRGRISANRIFPSAKQGILLWRKESCTGGGGGDCFFWMPLHLMEENHKIQPSAFWKSKPTFHSLFSRNEDTFEAILLCNIYCFLKKGKVYLDSLLFTGKLSLFHCSKQGSWPLFSQGFGFAEGQVA